MKIMLKVWILIVCSVADAIAQRSYEPDYLTQDTHYDSDEKSYHPSSRRYQRLRSYEPSSHEEEPSSDPRHYQSLEPTYPKHEPESYHRQHHVQYHNSRPINYHQPEDPSYHRPQEIVYHQAPQHYQDVPPNHHQSYEGSTHHLQPAEKEEPKYIDEEPKYIAEEPKYVAEEPKYVPEKSKYIAEEPKYIAEEPKYSADGAKHSAEETNYPHASRPRSSVTRDPKLPLYFTMYEKRTIQDPHNNYGKGPWRYLTYGHGITYGSKEPGKVFEKGYGYIRALGRDHCKLPEHLCPPRDEKPFDYEGRREPYYGYRPH